MNLFIWHAIPSDVLVDRFTMFLIVAESIENLGQCEVRQPPYDFLRSDAKFPQLGDRTNWSMGARHDGGSVENIFGADNVGVACGSSHDRGFLRNAQSVCKPTGGRGISQFSFTLTQ